jgi:hypothetical protein
MRPVSFAEDLQPGAPLSLFSEDKPDRYLTIVESLLESGIGLSVGDTRNWPSYPALDEEEREWLLVNEPDDRRRRISRFIANGEGW